MDMPDIENWSQMKSFAMGVWKATPIDEQSLASVRYMNHWARVCAGSSVLEDYTLEYHKGAATGYWLKNFTLEQKEEILQHYTILRLER